MPQPVPEPAKRQRKSAEQRRDDILSASRKVFAERGFRCADVQQIADRAGVGKGTIYRFHATKDDLFKATVEHAMQQLTGRVDDAIVGFEQPIEQLRAAFRAYLVFFQEYPEVIELFVHERAELLGAQPLYFVYSNARRRRWLDICQQLIDSGRCRISSPELILDALGNLAYGSVFVNRVSGRNEALTEHADELFDMLFMGILQDR